MCTNAKHLRIRVLYELTQKRKYKNKTDNNLFVLNNKKKFPEAIQMSVSVNHFYSTL